MPHVTSRDGTVIAYEVSGSGKPLILVDGALCYRDSGPMRPLAAELEDRFAVVTYDRRGRGESGNTLPWSLDREVEDIAALLAAVGGSAHVYGCSSGGAIALEAANRLKGLEKVIAYEIPFIVDGSRDPMTEETLRQFDAFVAAGRRSDAVKLFMRFVGVPGFVLFIMPLMGVWKKLTGIAHTLPYDLAIVGPHERGQPLPADMWSGVRVPVLVMDGGKSPPWIRNAMKAVSTILSGARYRTLEGQTHIVVAKSQAPVIKEFLA